LRGDVIAAPDGDAHDAVVRSYREALALAEARGMRPLSARCHFSLGAFLAGRNNQADAAPHLAAAASIYHDLGIVAPPTPARDEGTLIAASTETSSSLDRTEFQGRPGDRGPLSSSLSARRRDGDF
jgi:hypothetical protein